MVPEKVVEIINEQQKLDKIPYNRYQDLPNHKVLKNKLAELKSIFYHSSNEMEWEKINEKALFESLEEMMDKEVNELDRIPDWIKSNSFFRIGQRIVSITEYNAIMREYMTLNNNFE